MNILPQYVAAIQRTSLDFYEQSTDLLDKIEQFVDEIGTNISLREADTKLNRLEQYGKIFKELNDSKFTTPPVIDNTFKLFFVERYLSLHKNYRDKIDSYITDNKFFVELADSVGCAFNLQTLADETNTPFTDIDQVQYPIAIPVGSTMYSKLTKGEIIQLSVSNFFTTAMHRSNLQHIASSDLPTASHGSDLVTDVGSFDRLVLMRQSVLAFLQSLLGDINDFVVFFTNVSPRSQTDQAVVAKYTSKFEGIQHKVDLLGRLVNPTETTPIELLAIQ